MYTLTKKFPPEESYRLVDQLCLVSLSIPTNIAKGKGQGTTKEYIRFLIIAKGSIEETQGTLSKSRSVVSLIGKLQFSSWTWFIFCC
ncbi:four helix bundle protein [Leptodesmis sp.]|uniref:four helix bundle protein n=1 Tax=Leptodesmis sp. TaxID=3100501 RepID=UPI0040535371